MDRGKMQSFAETINWQEARQLFPCPAVMWQGVWEEVGELYGRSWDVWAATLCALGASVERKLYWYYCKAPLYGMTYVLIVAPTGSGKELCANISAALLPEDYNIRDAVQSGPALYPIMADPAMKGNPRPARPTALIIGEWTKLAKNAQIQHSSLVDDLNTLFHRVRPWNISRSERDFAGGDKWLTNPALSIFGTTTPEKLRSTVTEEMMNDGFLNRYLLLPGPTAEWEFWPSRAPVGDPAQRLAPLRARLEERRKEPAWGGGANYQEAFEPDAAKRIQEWGAPYFEPLMKSSSTQANRKKRLHMYAHLIAMLSAWGVGRRSVELGDVELAICAVETSSRFTDWLFADEPIRLNQTELGDLQAEDLIYNAVQLKPNFYDNRKLYENYKKRGLTGGKMRRATSSLLSLGKIFINPDTFCYVIKEEAFPTGGQTERGSFITRGDSTA